MTRWALAVLGLAVTMVGIWYLHQVMLDQAWARFDEAAGKWVLLAQGWGVLWRAWPVLLIGLVVGAGGTWAAGVRAGSLAAARDLAERITEVEQQRAQAEARRTYEEAQLEALKRRAQDQMRAAAATKAAAERQVQEAHQRIAAAAAQAAEAENRRANAAGCAERRHRQLERLRSQAVDHVSIEQVFEAAHELGAEGVTPTVATVRERIGSGA